MIFLGPLLSSLQQLAAPLPVPPRDPWAFYTRQALHPSAAVPGEWLVQGEADSAGHTRALYRRFALSAALRMLAAPSALEAGPEGALFHPGAIGDQLFVSAFHAESAPVDLLWQAWLLHLMERAGISLPVCSTPFSSTPSELWRRAFHHQSSAGHLHPLTSEISLDAFVFEELGALHAAGTLALQTADAELTQRVRAMVDWHVGHTQPDNSTCQPWALAAFAAFDSTHTFAAQQLHDAATMLAAHSLATGSTPVALALLADAVITLRDAGPKSR